MSRTIGDTQLVDELVLTFTHDWEMPAILPGVIQGDFCRTCLLSG